MMKCYNVVCVDEDAKRYVVGVMTSDPRRAMIDAEETLLEGRHIKAVAIDAQETDGI